MVQMPVAYPPPPPANVNRRKGRNCENITLASMRYTHARGNKTFRPNSLDKNRIFSFNISASVTLIYVHVIYGYVRAYITI